MRKRHSIQFTAFLYTRFVFPRIFKCKCMRKRVKHNKCRLCTGVRECDKYTCKHVSTIEPFRRLFHSRFHHRHHQHFCVFVILFCFRSVRLFVAFALHSLTPLSFRLCCIQMLSVEDNVCMKKSKRTMATI